MEKEEQQQQQEQEEPNDDDDPPSLATSFRSQLSAQAGLPACMRDVVNHGGIHNTATTRLRGRKRGGGGAAGGARSSRRSIPRETSRPTHH
jgi:hypothetical protein